MARANIHQTIRLVLTARQTEYSVVLPDTTYRVKVTPVSTQVCYVSFTTGLVATSGGSAAKKTTPFDTGEGRAEQATTVYIASPTAGSVVLIEHWS